MYVIAKGRRGDHPSTRPSFWESSSNSSVPSELRLLAEPIDDSPPAQHNSGRLVKKSFQDAKFDGKRSEGCRLQLLGMWRPLLDLGDGQINQGIKISTERCARMFDIHSPLCIFDILQFHLIRVIYEGVNVASTVPLSNTKGSAIQPSISLRMTTYRWWKGNNIPKQYRLTENLFGDP